MKKLLLGGAATAAAIAIAPVFAQTPAPKPVAPATRMNHAQTRAEVAQQVQVAFAKLDSDRNGSLTKGEADAGREGVRKGMVKHASERRAEHSFSQIDTDGNGSISRTEFDAAHANRVGRASEDRKKMAEMRGAHIFGGRMFDMGDTNKDGRLTLQEATNAALQHFDMVDANRDGQISRDERSQMRKKMRSDRRPG